MNHKINAGRLRHYVEVYADSGGQNEYGEPIGKTLVFDARADVLVRSGGEADNYGTTVTNEVITVLMWYDDRLKNDMFIVWEGVEYRVLHTQPNHDKRSMVATCEVIKK